MGNNTGIVRFRPRRRKTVKALRRERRFIVAGMVIGASAALAIIAGPQSYDEIAAVIGRQAEFGAQRHGAFAGRVTRIVDGDTMHVAGAGAPVRIWGLDAPERNETGFIEATNALSNICAGKSVNCEELDRDKYGRIVARCYLPNGDDIAAEMIKSGTADEYLFFSRGYYRNARRGS
jgi:endonuclease YncB( thermonuclease family)